MPIDNLKILFLNFNYNGHVILMIYTIQLHTILNIIII